MSTDKLEAHSPHRLPKPKQIGWCSLPDYTTEYKLGITSSVCLPSMDFSLH